MRESRQRRNENINMHMKAGIRNSESERFVKEPFFGPAADVAVDSMWGRCFPVMFQ